MVTGEQRIESPARRVTATGRHLLRGDDPLRVHGVTYGSFTPRGDGARFPEASVVTSDFAAMQRLGIDTVRTYELPPVDVLDAADAHGLQLMVGLHYHDWLTEPHTGRRARHRVTDAACRAVDDALELIAGRQTILAVAVGNEVPVDLVRLHGRHHVEDTLGVMIQRLHSGDPDLLTTYVNFPTTEFLDVPDADIVSFNVFLEDHDAFRRYAEHLQLVSRNRPLLFTELGLASEIHGLQTQATTVADQLRCIDEVGAAGGFVFSWTDDWVVGGEPITGWGFGVTTADREHKPVGQTLSEWSGMSYPKGLRDQWPRVTVVVCAYNEEATIRECLGSVLASSYPDLELILCDDGSTDATATIAAELGVRTLALDHGGLSRARNAGLEESTGSIIAYLDADAACHPDWPFHLALSMEEGFAATGGPNLAVPDAGWVERAIAHAPGQASEVLLGEGRAEHVPGCNMAFDRERLAEIGGFDVRYVAAGDDVDVCWKLLDRGHEIGFSPSAQVDHHRRSTIRGFLRQQRGYGRAERMLSGPHQHRLNRMGQARWRGFVYGPGALLPRLLRSTVYTGWSGSAPFQPVRDPRAEHVGANVIATLPFVLAIGLLAAPLALLAGWAIFVTAAAAAWLVGVGIAAGLSAQLSHHEPRPARVRLVTGFVTVLQPIVRTWGRLTGSELAVDSEDPSTWVGDRLAWIDDLTLRLRARGAHVRAGRTGDFFDLEVAMPGPVAAQITTAVAWGWEPRWTVHYRPRRAWLGATALAVLVLMAAGLSPVAAVGATVAVLIVAATMCTTALHRQVRRAVASTIAETTTTDRIDAAT